MAPKCLKCGYMLVRRKFVDVEDEHGNPTEVYENWVCLNCSIRWMPLDLTGMIDH